MPDRIARSIVNNKVAIALQGGVIAVAGGGVGVPGRFAGAGLVEDQVAIALLDQLVLVGRGDDGLIFKELLLGDEVWK